MYIPGFGDVSTPEALRETLARNSKSAAKPTSQQRSFEEALRLGLPSYAAPSARRTLGLDKPDVLKDLGSTGPVVDDKAPPAPTNDGVSGGNPYPTVLPPLTPEMQSALDARRRAASRAYEQAAIQVDDARMAAEAQRLFTEQQIDEATARARREGMTQLAARGVARSPMFANPFRRELVRQQQAQLGEAEATLAGTLEQLGRTLQAAELQAEREYADIGVAAMQGRSNIGRLLGIA